MKYERIKKARFLRRVNRFVAEIELNGSVQQCHVKNTGRCTELFVPDASVYVQEMDVEGRKTKYDLIAVKKGTELVNVDSQAANKVFAEWLNSGGFGKKPELLRPEVTYGRSRFDFYVETGGKAGFFEVKGVTLERNGVALFPDAPTERGIKHINELVDAVNEGYQAGIVFIIQMASATQLCPNNETHPAFGQALRNAQRAGVAVRAFRCNVSEQSLTVEAEVPVKLIAG